MINIIYGAKGTGKTKMIIDRANASIEKHVGDIAFLADTTRYIHDIKYQIRLTNTKDSKIESSDGLIGFVQGMIEANYDIRNIYIDGVLRMTNKSLNELAGFFERLESISNKSDTNFTLTISASAEELPEFLRKYI
ncbi:MAG: hypothetical protein R3Y23_06400 [Bacillota bacterium]